MAQKSQVEDFKKKELCWAKIKGYPWWPAIIRDIFISKDKKNYFVGYLCEKNGSSLSEMNIKKWKENYEKYKDGGLKQKNSNNTKNDFLSALTIGNMYYEGKIDSDDHENFLNVYQNSKERHSMENIEKFFNKVIKEKQEKIQKEEKQKQLKINKEKEKIVNKTNKKLIGRKRNISKIKNTQEIKIKEEIIEIKETKDEIKDNEINIKQKELNKIENLVNNITSNLDKIIIHGEKYQKFFEKENKEKNISINDNKNIKTKIEITKYLLTMIEALNVPFSLNNIIQNMNIKQ